MSYIQFQHVVTNQQIVNEDTDYHIPISHVSPTILSDTGRAWMFWKKAYAPECGHLFSWIIFSKEYSDSIWYFYVALLNLQKDKEIKVKGATHEFQLLGAPQQLFCVNLLPSITARYYNGQFYSRSDQLAAESTRETVIDICRGVLDPTNCQEELILTYGNDVYTKSNEDCKIELADNQIN
jgi:hypothetical protein